mmetsp:Transcript_100555/g.139753  ORF Transcript_100555/g.139753 Transcript_100555/m.139753 type:complete len:256 (-) Transcript_100555:29-796(-)
MAVAFVPVVVPSLQRPELLSAAAPREARRQVESLRRGSFRYAGPTLPTLALLCLAGRKTARRSATSDPKSQPADAEQRQLTTRKKSDPQNITMLDMGTGYTVKQDLNKPLISASGSKKDKVTVRRRENVKDPEELMKEVAAESEDMDEDFLKDLLEMTEVQRADLIEELTRKAFVLMDAGEIAEAKQHLDRASRIADAFDRLNQEFEIIREKRSTGQRKDETQVVLELQKELDKEDFNMIFGARAKFSRYIGGIS